MNEIEYGVLWFRILINLEPSSGELQPQSYILDKYVRGIWSGDWFFHTKFCFLKTNELMLLVISYTHCRLMFLFTGEGILS